MCLNLLRSFSGAFPIGRLIKKPAFVGYTKQQFEVMGKLCFVGLFAKIIAFNGCLAFRRIFVSHIVVFSV